MPLITEIQNKQIILKWGCSRIKVQLRLE